MRQSTRRRRLEQSRRGWDAPPRGPFGPVRIQAQTAERLEHPDASGADWLDPTTRENQTSRGATMNRLSITAFFEYLQDHNATTDLAKALGEVVMLRTSGAMPIASSDRAQIAS